MKLIVLDFVRRWGWFYLGWFLLACSVDAMVMVLPGPAGSPGLLAPYFSAPILGPMLVLGFDFMRGAAGVMTALPVSMRRLGISYWIVGVLIPPIVLTVALILAKTIVYIFNPSLAFASESVALTFAASLLMCGSMFFPFTRFTAAPQEGLWDNVIAVLAMVFVVAGMWYGMFVKNVLESMKGDLVTISGLAVVGVLLTVLGFLRAEALVLLRARNRSGSTTSVHKSGEPRADLKSAISGIPFMFLESIKLALLMVIMMTGFAAIMRSSGNLMPMQFPLVICGFLPSFRYAASLRQMRALPISMDKLALTIFVLPLANIVVCAMVLWFAQATGLPLGFKAEAGALILLAGGLLLGMSLVLRLGAARLPWIVGLGVALVFLLQEVLRAAPLFTTWLIGLLLAAAAYVLIRLSLQSSEVYRTAGASPFSV